ncbi:hypothetical protein EXIGLDRAFT_770023 [Exidia glandulosa HHB12029]|uniref:Uncharacterized protein n=1 Tax=Exidia glandulosa HHB12029 TaxID=1314781 RepID=A0A166AF21_EXIGL|nr:hypothetical protein EXIGLDRAFT_770023 [Exidia glandulosa HHB12029]
MGLGDVYRWVLQTSTNGSGYPRTIWKYNAAAHLLSEHADGDYSPEATARMFIAMHIQRDEEIQMKIPAANTTAFQTAGQLPDSDAVEELRSQYAPPTGSNSVVGPSLW